MHVFPARLHFALHAAFSLKEKRHVARSLIDRTQHKFHCSVAEVDSQDSHHELVVGVALCTGDFAHGEQQLQHILRYMEEMAEAELMDVQESSFRLS